MASPALDSTDAPAEGATSWTHTAGAGGANGLLLVDVRTVNDDTPPTSVMVGGIAMSLVPNSAAVSSISDTMGTWTYAKVLGTFAASSTYAITITGGAGNWVSQSTIYANADQTLTDITVAGQVQDNVTSVTSWSVPLTVPSGGLVHQSVAIWTNGTTGTMSNNGTTLHNDTGTYNQTWTCGQYTTSASPLTGGFSTGKATVCAGSYAIKPAASSGSGAAGFFSIL